MAGSDRFAYGQANSGARIFVARVQPFERLENRFGVALREAYAFIFDQKGLMAGISIEGTKISHVKTP